jgi:RNA polymerase sigma-70 factor (ECF subfamily)
MIDNTNKFQSIFKEFNSKLKAYIQSKVSNPSDIDDILQEVYIRIHLNLSKIKNDEKLTPWIYKICRNIIFDHYRKNKKIYAEIENEIHEEINDLTALETLSSGLHIFIDKLPNVYKNAILESEINGLKQKDIATLEKITISAAKSRVQRGRDKLKELLLDCCNYEFDSRNELCCYSKKTDSCKKIYYK